MDVEVPINVTLLPIDLDIPNRELPLFLYSDFSFFWVFYFLVVILESLKLQFNLCWDFSAPGTVEGSFKCKFGRI